MRIWSLFTGFLEDFLKALVDEILGGLQNLFGDLFHCTFFIENTVGLGETVLTPGSISVGLGVLYTFMVLLLVLKLLWKGANVYILWRDGESETPPGEMVLGAILAIITAVAFPILYELSVSITREILDTICAAMFSEYPGWIEDCLDFVKELFTVQGNAVTNSLLMLWLAILYLLVYLATIFVMLKQGAELLIFRLGIPIAAIGLVNSDGGSWKPYIQTFIRMLATAIVRFFCLYLGMHLYASFDLVGTILGIVFTILAFSAPTLLAQFMAPKGSGGTIQSIQALASVVKAFGGKA